MNIRNWIGRSWKTSLLVLVATAGVALQSSEAQAFHHHFGFFGHHWHAGWGGYHHVYRPYWGYRSIGYAPWGYSSLSYGTFYIPRHYAPIYTYRAPIYTYRVAVPVIPTYYVAPTYYSVPECAYPVSSSYSTFYVSQSESTIPTPSVAPAWAPPAPSPLFASADGIERANARSQQFLSQSPMANVARSSEPVPSSSRQPTGLLVSKSPVSVGKPAVGLFDVQDDLTRNTLQPYSPVWTASAIGLVDAMVAEGDVETARSACDRMAKVTHRKASGVYLRTALLNYFAPDQSSSQSFEDILDVLEQACVTGSTMSSSELPKGSLTDYLADASIDVTSSLDSLSKHILEHPERAGNELLMLSALLSLDGQTERTKLFADTASQLSAQSESFRWPALLQTLVGNDG